MKLNDNAIACIKYCYEVKLNEQGYKSIIKRTTITMQWLKIQNSQRSMNFKLVTFKSKDKEYEAKK